MARIRVYRDEAHGEYFPRLCMRCGQPADCDVPHMFAWVPGWVFLLIFLGFGPCIFVALIMRKTMRVVVPMCSDHRRHWLIRRVYVWLGLLGWAGVVFLLRAV